LEYDIRALFDEIDHSLLLKALVVPLIDPQTTGRSRQDCATGDSADWWFKVGRG
jgi:retron-type reverse transcriptase